MIEKIFLIHAPARSGKDTCGEVMKEYYESKGKRVCMIAFADAVKFTLEKYYGITDFKSPEGRSHIQHYATDQCRGVNPTLWADWVAEWLKATEADWDIAIISDWRFLNEYDVLDAVFGKEYIRTMYIERPDIDVISDLTEEQRHHQSESELNNYKHYDYVIKNRTGEFMSTIRDLLEVADKEEEEN